MSRTGAGDVRSCLSPPAAAEVGQEIGAHARDSGGHEGRDRAIALAEASTQFPLRGVRYGLIAVGASLLVFAGVLILLLPVSPG